MAHYSGHCNVPPGFLYRNEGLTSLLHPWASEMPADRQLSTASQAFLGIALVYPRSCHFPEHTTLNTCLVQGNKSPVLLPELLAILMGHNSFRALHEVSFMETAHHISIPPFSQSCFIWEMNQELPNKPSVQSTLQRWTKENSLINLL